MGTLRHCFTGTALAVSRPAEIDDLALDTYTEWVVDR